jgi:hypothetical protein
MHELHRPRYAARLWCGRPLPPPSRGPDAWSPAQLTAAGCGARPRVAHGSPYRACPRTSCAPYPVRHGWVGTRPHAARDGQDRTPHVDEDPFSQAARRCSAETACFKRLFQCFKCFRGVACVLYRCCKSRSRSCTFAMVFSSVCPKCFICFRRML